MDRCRPFHDDARDDLWRHTLSRISSTFGRLIYLSRLRNPDTGRYEHHGLASVYGAAETDRILGDSHSAVFREWIESGLQAQKADLTVYLTTLSTDVPTVLRNWMSLTPYRNCVPESATSSEQDLYMADMEALLGVFRSEFGVSGGEDSNSRRRPSLAR